MAVLTKATYESLAEKIGNAYASQKAALPYVASGLAEVVLLSDADQEYDMLFAWYNTNVSLNTSLNSTSSFTVLASSLNAHAELRSGQTLTAFLTDEGITVTSNFAIVSKAAGWDVDAFIA